MIIVIDTTNKDVATISGNVKVMVYALRVQNFGYI